MVVHILTLSPECQEVSCSDGKQIIAGYHGQGAVSTYAVQLTGIIFNQEIKYDKDISKAGTIQGRHDWFR